MRRTRWTGITATVVVPFMLAAGCSTADDEVTNDSPEDSPEEAEQSSGDEDYATVVKLEGVAWFDRMATGVESFDEDYDVNAFQQGPAQADSAQQVQVIEDIIAQGVDVLAVVPFQPDAVESVLGRAQDAGITVVTHEAPELENTEYDVEPFRNEEYGAHLMDELAERMDEEGEYALMVGSLTSATHMAWVEAAQKHQEENYPDMTFVGDYVETSDDTQTAYERTRELLSTYPDLKGIQGSSAVDIVGAGQAIEEAGLTDDIAVVGTSVPSNVKDLLETGAVDLMSGWDPGAAGYAMNEVARRIRAGEEISSGADLGAEGYDSIEVDGSVIYGNDAWIDVDADNVDEYDF
ncbi:autoinducer 2 ABC transporter substrate-binding protein [Actinobacteria bacterium YIM 96077]|uniref:Autoinducer 2 ABC transporter substrate-binding protein n=1 Tax=Phytoactinopolyspora halophila TaxID=1981511 RepID=A0A329QN91_9ACTN|nr:autoinducer 2 ABC transporter substrate-binding protein [Phytoactinopolyspora halophila]AYY12259.1 autoinducer 2 ABC transporter substrate-binding protein [Actinobacteria bacterium YIM 96077]RAW13824.1 autoinducer 2 ABC transporter substrate-binding protein [Phytoactinopolyspora halophila]